MMMRAIIIMPTESGERHVRALDRPGDECAEHEREDGRCACEDDRVPHRRPERFAGEGAREVLRARRRAKGIPVRPAAPSSGSSRRSSGTATPPDRSEGRKARCRRSCASPRGREEMAFSVRGGRRRRAMLTFPYWLSTQPTFNAPLFRFACACPRFIWLRAFHTFARADKLCRVSPLHQR